VEERLQDALSPFLCTLFSRFHERKDIWNAALNLISEIDFLASLAIVSGQQHWAICRPEFIENEGEFKNSSILDIR
jgi:DNA mismatch repair ATPase MutS